MSLYTYGRTNRAQGDTVTDAGSDIRHTCAECKHAGKGREFFCAEAFGMRNRSQRACLKGRAR